MKQHITLQSPLLWLALFLTGIIACGKDDPTQEDCPPDLPCDTQYGANTFGCYIDGMPWVAKVEPNVFDPTSHPLEISYDESGYGGFNNNNVKIKARYHSIDDYQFFAIIFDPLIRPGDIDLDSLAYADLSLYLQKSYNRHYAN